jgi:hypothetical protein
MTNRTTSVYRVDVTADIGFLCIIATSVYRAKLCAKRAGYVVTGVAQVQA